MISPASPPQRRLSLSLPCLREEVEKREETRAEFCVSHLWNMRMKQNVRPFPSIVIVIVKKKQEH